MTDFKKMQPERPGTELPETYSDIWAEAARSAYPDLSGRSKSDAVFVLASNTTAESLKLPTLEIDFEGPKPVVDHALLKADQIAVRLNSDEFEEREQGSAQLKELLRTEVSANKPSAELQKIFQLAASEEAEVRSRVNTALNAVFKEAMDSKDLAGLKHLLTHKEATVRDWAIKKLQDSPQLVETLPKLASTAEKEKNADLAEAIRKVAAPIDKKALFQDLLPNGVWGTEWNKIFRDAGSMNLSKLSDEERADAIKQVLAQVKSAVTSSDDMQNSELGALASILNTPEKRMPSGQDMPNLVQGAPFESRTITSRALIMMAQELKEAGKDPKAVDALQAAAIALYKESLALPGFDATYNRTWRDSWTVALKTMRDLNPEQFDRLVPDKLIQEPRFMSKVSD